MKSVVVIAAGLLVLLSVWFASVAIYPQVSGTLATLYVVLAFITCLGSLVAFMLLLLQVARVASRHTAEA